MGLRASMELSRLKGDVMFKVWPSERTVLIRADKGMGSKTYSEGASRFFDLENWTSNIELHELHGSHFGILHPNSGLAKIINKVLDHGDEASMKN
jgi:fatty acid synthase, animal type